MKNEPSRRKYFEISLSNYFNNEIQNKFYENHIDAIDSNIEKAMEYYKNSSINKIPEIERAIVELLPFLLIDESEYVGDYSFIQSAKDSKDEAVVFIEFLIKNPFTASHILNSIDEEYRYNVKYFEDTHEYDSPVRIDGKLQYDENGIVFKKVKGPFSRDKAYKVLENWRSTNVSRVREWYSHCIPFFKLKSALTASEHKPTNNSIFVHGLVTLFNREINLNSLISNHFPPPKKD